MNHEGLEPIQPQKCNRDATASLQLRNGNYGGGEYSAISLIKGYITTTQGRKRQDSAWLKPGFCVTFVRSICELTVLTLSSHEMTVLAQSVHMYF